LDIAQAARTLRVVYITPAPPSPDVLCHLGDSGTLAGSRDLVDNAAAGPAEAVTHRDIGTWILLENGYLEINRREKAFIAKVDHGAIRGRAKDVAAFGLKALERPGGE
jgi:hypothetical protein